jgi:DNA ligase D-like protein (predicted polymerase)
MTNMAESLLCHSISTTMLVRKNTKEFRAVRNILEMYAGRSTRKKVIRLFIVKTGEKLDKRIPVEKLGKDADVYYDINYSAILSNLHDHDHRLHRSESLPGLYYFRSAHFPGWDQAPFLLPSRLVERLDDFSEIAVPSSRPQRAGNDRPADSAAFEGVPRESKNKPKKNKKQPKSKTESPPGEAVYGDKHRIVFTNISDVVFDEGDITMQEVLEYYDSMSDHILPYVKDRPQAFYLDGKRDVLVKSIERLKQHIPLKMPSWIKKIKTYSGKEDKDKHYFVCKDRDHLFYLLKMGSLELHPWLSRVSSPAHPDYFVINLRPYGSSINSVIEVAQCVRDVLAGSFRSFIKLSEHGGFHIYVPWDEKVSFSLSTRIASFVAEQVYSHTRKLSSLHLEEAEKEKKVHIDISDNKGKTHTLIAPYSLIHSSGNALVAAPLEWDEVKKGLKPAEFNIYSMPGRVKKVGDVFKGLVSE